MDCLECLYLRTTKKGARRSIGLALAHIGLDRVPTGALPHFCAEHQVTLDPSPVQSFGYFVAKGERLCGNYAHSLIARDIYDRFGLTPKFAQNYDGVSISVNLEGKQTTYFVVQNFFDHEKFTMICHELEAAE